MTHEVRAPTEAELADWSFIEGAAFGLHHGPVPDPVEDQLLSRDRVLAAFDGERMVGTANSYAFAMTVPGGGAVPVAGVSSVAVSATHRRRGILRALMETQLAEVADRGDVAAVLNASEAVIYGRFGYGMATRFQSFSLDTTRAAFRSPVADPGSLELLRKSAARPLLVEAWERARPTCPGELARSELWWDAVLGPIIRWKGGGDVFVVVHRDAEGRPDGYVIYTVAHATLPDRWRLHVRELVAADDTVRAVLWRYLLDVDLVGTVTSEASPVDDPLPWLLADTREARVTRLHDYLWVRPLDIEAYGSARAYPGEAAVVVEVTDQLHPRSSGCYRFEPAGDGEPGACTRTDEEPDVALEVAELGAVSLGGIAVVQLARAGLVAERRPGGLARADRLFAWPQAPFCATRF